jgi:hypothetical protein
MHGLNPHEGSLERMALGVSELQIEYIKAGRCRAVFEIRDGRAIKVRAESR